jgi:ankyrin repeat protein
MHEAALATHALVQSIADELNEDFVPYYWAENERASAMVQSETWQTQLPRPADPNVVLTICLFGERIGDLLPGTFTPPDELQLPGIIWFDHVARAVPDGLVPLTGTLFEHFDALTAHRLLPSDGRERRHAPLALFCADRATVYQRSRPPDQRGWGFYRSKEAQRLQEQDSEYHRQIGWLTQFFDWATDPAERQSRPISLFGRAGDRTTKPLIDQLRPQIEGLFARKLPRWRQLKALEAYTRTDHEGFFGREAWVRKALAKLGTLGRPPDGKVALLITGPSGIGKSSALQAGLIGTLDRRPARMEGITALRVCFWSLRGLTPAQETDPVASLGAWLAESGALPELGDAEEFAALLRDKSEAEQQHWFATRLRRTLAGLGGSAEDGTARLLLALDQFEELTNRLDDSGKLPDPWRRFMAVLAHLVETRLLWLVGTLSDERAPLFRPLLGPLEALCQTEPLRNPDDTNLHAIIEQSLKLVGLQAEAALRERLVQEATAITGQGGCVLPLLSMHLTRLVQIFEERQRALNLQRAEPGTGRSNLLRVADFDQDLALGRTIAVLCEQGWEEGARTTASPTRDLDFERMAFALVRVRILDSVAVRELRDASRKGRALQNMAGVVRALMQRRILVPSTSVERLRLSHPAITQVWPRLHAAMERNEAMALLEEELTARAGRWQAQGRDAKLLPDEGEPLDGLAQLLMIRRDGLDPLLRAYASKAIEGVRDQFLNVNKKARPTPMAIAGSLGDLDLIRCLRDHGVDLDLGGDRGGTPLAYAARAGELAAVELLLELGAKSDVADEDGDTPLIQASIEGHAEIFALLLPRADPARQGEFRYSPLHWAAQNGHYAIVQMLLEANPAGTTARSVHQRIPLHLAALAKHEPIVSLLLAADSKGARARDHRLHTPLHLAAFNGHEAVVRLLLAADPEGVEARDDRQATPLHLAAL